jgi:hypothetical protein
MDGTRDGNVIRALAVAGCISGCFWLIIAALVWGALA